ncbi:protein E8 [Elephant endotheliotropic herpesvirus 6]|nr:protein E8 [Elephant endotheliotropic herpesvirus 6]
MRKYMNLINAQQMPGIFWDLCGLFALVIFTFIILVIVLCLLCNRDTVTSILDPIVCVGLSYFVYSRLFLDRTVFGGKSYNWLSKEEGQFITVFKTVYTYVVWMMTGFVIILYIYTKISREGACWIISLGTCKKLIDITSRRVVPITSLLLVNLDLYTLQSGYTVIQLFDTETFKLVRTEFAVTKPPSICIDKSLDFLIYVTLVITISELVDYLKLVDLTHVPLVGFMCCFVIHKFVYHRYIRDQSNYSMYFTMEMNLLSCVLYLTTRVLMFMCRSSLIIRIVN